MADHTTAIAELHAIKAKYDDDLAMICGARGAADRLLGNASSSVIALVDHGYRQERVRAMKEFNDAVAAWVEQNPQAAEEFLKD